MDFFTLFDTLQLEQLHLIHQQLLASFHSVASYLPPVFYHVLVKRALLNNVLKVKKSLLEYFLTLQDPTQLACLKQYSILNDPNNFPIIMDILHQSSRQSFYQTTGFGNL